MADYRLAPRAAIDLEAILEYSIENFGLSRAEQYRSELAECLRQVAADPRLGRTFGARRRVFYRYNCRRHAIFFTIEPDAIFVVRVLHASMDFKRHLPK